MSSSVESTTQNTATNDSDSDFENDLQSFNAVSPIKSEIEKEIGIGLETEEVSMKPRSPEAIVTPNGTGSIATGQDITKDETTSEILRFIYRKRNRDHSLARLQSSLRQRQ
ncbi:hypothetical protein L596_012395 [Steinernema carpocapsae]|uniref:Uncharacterized protein n=1 Tax=Steinernema carpocapsae TaxID=34508 RepID=A0A4U5NXT2_STECR|nr:hypothetical protein L596_012395 [Steinernema carpocapsae]